MMNVMTTTNLELPARGKSREHISNIGARFFIIRLTLGIVIFHRCECVFDTGRRQNSANFFHGVFRNHVTVEVEMLKSWLARRELRRRDGA